MSSLALSPPKRLRTIEVSTTLREHSQQIVPPKSAITPYTTPFKKRNRSSAGPNLKNQQIKKAVKKLKRLLNKQWYFFNVSPLYNINYSEVSMKRYARRLKEKLMSRLPDESGTEYDVSYATFPNLQLNSIDHQAIEVTVIKISENGNQSVAYNAILLSWGAAANMQPENATFLPILLCQGLKGVIKQVHMEFQLVHDCFVSPFDMHDGELRTLCVGIFDHSSYEENNIIKLRYCLPQKVKTGALDISLPTIILSELWKCVHQSQLSPYWTDTDVSSFWNEIHTHTHRSFGIDLSCCGLVKVTLPDVAFTLNAVNAKDKEQLYFFLCFLMNLNPSLSSAAPHLHEVVLSDW